MRLNDLRSGVYDIRIKGADTLSVLKASVSVPPESAVDFGTLPVGDSTGNDVIDGLLTLHIVAGAGAVDTVQAYITFDPAYLQIVDTPGQHVLSASFRTFHLAV